MRTMSESDEEAVSQVTLGAVREFRYSAEISGFVVSAKADVTSAVLKARLYKRGFTPPLVLLWKNKWLA